VVLAPNWLGDAVMALPAVQALRDAFPAARLDIAARASIAPLFALTPLADRVLTLQRGPVDLAAIRSGAYDTAILLPNSFASAMLVWRAGIAERWGYRGDGRAWLLTKAIAPPAAVHQIDYYQHLVAACGCSPGDGIPTLTVDADLRAQAAMLLRSEGWKETTALVAMAPGAAFGTAKRWPAASFATLADRFAARGVQVVVIGSAADAPAARELIAASAAAAPPIDLTGRTDLRMLAGILAHCRRLITNDSGAMHFAAALGLDITAMFGPTRERETAPRGRGRQAALTHAVWCRPCMLRDCPLTHRCMRGITPEAVFEASGV
jgi:heptosyltransferase-2